MILQSFLIYRKVSSSDVCAHLEFIIEDYACPQLPLATEDFWVFVRCYFSNSEKSKMLSVRVLDPDNQYIIKTTKCTLSQAVKIGPNNYAGNYVFKPSSITFQKEGMHKINIFYGDKLWLLPFNVHIGN